MPPIQPISKVSYEFECEDSDAFWRVYHLDLQEALNQTYSLNLKLITKDFDTDITKLLGADATFRILRDGIERPVSGVITSCRALGLHQDSLLVRVLIEPAFRLLAQSSHCRIFQDRSPKEIIEELLEEQLGPYQRKFNWLAEKRGDKPRDYCVQYHESDFDFICRLLAEEGINYHFEHESHPGFDTLVFTDANAQLVNSLNTDGTPVYPINYGAVYDKEVETIESIRDQHRLMPTSALRCDWDWESVKVLREQKNEVDNRKRNRPIYRPMGRRYTGDDLEQQVQDRSGNYQRQSRHIEGSSNAIAFGPAKRIELENYQGPCGLEDAKLILTSLSHSGHCPEELIGADSVQDQDDGEDMRYGNHFSCVLAETELRPERPRSKPTIHGPQTAVVSGPKNDEIYTEEHGRIKVRFHWDDSDSRDDASTCWVRVAQGWSGPGWGFQFLPRVGMEVIVEFLEGDPERPLVTGCVYNGKNPYPYKLPNKKTQSGIKTASSPGGKGYNELRFEDAKGREELHLRAQKNMSTKVLHNNSREIGADDQDKVGGNRNIEINGNVELKIGGSPVPGGGDVCTTDFQGRNTNITGDSNLTVSKGVLIKADESITLQVADTKIVITPNNIELSAASDFSKLELTSQGALLRTNGNLETVSELGTAITANTSLAVDCKLTADITAQGIMTLKGAMVKIN